MREPVAGVEQIVAMAGQLSAPDVSAVARRVLEATTSPLPGSIASSAADVLLGVCDLTSLEASDTPGRVEMLAATAASPDPDDPSAPPVAALCVHADLAAAARGAVDASGVKVAVAAACGAFPHGRASLQVKLADAADAVAGGADELDVVMDRAALLSGEYARVVRELVAIGEVAGGRPVKVIVESGELPDLSTVRVAAFLALASGAEFVKTSTGKSRRGADLEAVAVICDTVSGFADDFGQLRGVKVSGGVRTVADAAGYLAVFAATVGEDQVVPGRFRIGASDLVSELVRYRRATRSGRLS